MPIDASYINQHPQLELMVADAGEPTIQAIEQPTKNVANSNVGNSSDNVSLKVTLFNLLIHRYGAVTSFNVDQKNQFLDMTVSLKGEHEPIFVQIQGFDFIHKGDKYYIQFKRCTTSRQWLTELISANFVEDRYEVENQAMFFALQKILSGTVRQEDVNNFLNFDKVEQSLREKYNTLKDKYNNDEDIQRFKKEMQEKYDKLKNEYEQKSGDFDKLKQEVNDKYKEYTK